MYMYKKQNQAIKRKDREKIKIHLLTLIRH